MLTMVCNSLAVRSVLFQEAQEPLNGLLVVLMLLAFDDDLHPSNVRKHDARTYRGVLPSCHGK